MKQEKTIGYEEQFKTKYKLNNNPDDDRYIYLVPQDINFPKRYQDASKSISAHLEKLSKLKKHPKTEEEIQKTINAVYEADEFVKSQIDYIFNYAVSEIVFGNVSCLTVDNETGEYLCEKFLNCMIPIIEQEFDVSVKKVDIRVKQYTNKKGAYSSK